MAALILNCLRSVLELEQPFESARASWHRRTLLRLELRGESHVGHGEASPLPGHSPDDIDDCERALGNLGGLDELESSTSARQIFDWVSTALPERLPAARFALETAALDRLGQKLARPLWSLLRAADMDDAVSGPPCALRVAAVLPSEDPIIALGSAKRRFEAGVRAFKLKVGPDILQPAQERTLQALRTEFAASVELRVDANQSFARPTLFATFERLARLAVSLVEEPIARPLPAELAVLPCGFALDESLAGASFDSVRSFLELPGCRALVLKPTLLGGLNRCLQLAWLADSYGKSAVASHTLEGPIGFAACVHLALALPSGVAHGLWPLLHQLPGGVPPPIGPARFEGDGLGVPHDLLVRPRGGA